MAATIICKDPRKYGFDPGEVMFEAPLMFEEVVIDKCLEIRTIADAVGVSVEDIQDLNPELLRKHTPPKASKYKIKLPIGTRDSFMSQYAAMESPQETSWVRHTIRRGETISTIAARYGVSQYAIREANNMRTSRIYAGKTLIVPVPLDGAPSSSPRDRTANNGIYIVQSGDALYDISRSFGISVKSLKDYNGIGNSDRIYVNQRLRIPGQTSSSNEYAQSNVSKPSPKPASTIDASGSHLVHKVRRGENLTLIAKKYDVSVAQLRVWNSLGASLVIYPGQRLKVYGGSSSGESDAVYVVRGGDSLWEIATRYGVSVNKLIAWNDLSTSAIQPGQQLRLNAPDINGGDGPVWHVVRRGENLSRIASLYNTSVKQIMNDNNIRNPRSLRVGVKLKIGG